MRAIVGSSTAGRALDRTERARRGLGGLLLGGLLMCCSGCPLRAASSAPPMTQAELNFQDDELDLTQGVALAISCREPWWGTPCESLTVSSDDPSVATVSLMHLDKYRSGTGYVADRGHQRSVFLIAGVRPGVTNVRIDSDSVNEQLLVRVHPLKIRPGSEGPGSEGPGSEATRAAAKAAGSGITGATGSSIAIQVGDARPRP